jgi:hypothetical protein
MTSPVTPALVDRLRTMYSHRGDGLPTQPVNPDGEEAAARIEALEGALRDIRNVSLFHAAALSADEGLTFTSFVYCANDALGEQS